MLWRQPIVRLKKKAVLSVLPNKLLEGVVVKEESEQREETAAAMMDSVGTSAKLQRTFAESVAATTSSTSPVIDKTRLNVFQPYFPTSFASRCCDFHGTFNGTTCECSEGFTGMNCSLECPQQQVEDSLLVCSGAGECVADANSTQALCDCFASLQACGEVCELRLDLCGDCNGDNRR